MKRQASLAVAGSLAMVLSACASGRSAPRLPPPPPPPPPPGYVEGPVTATPAPVPAPRIIPRAAASQPAGTTCRYCVSSDPGKRQYFDQRRKRYYYFDRVRKAYFWENGEPKI